MNVLFDHLTLPVSNENPQLSSKTAGPPAHFQSSNHISTFTLFTLAAEFDSIDHDHLKHFLN